MKLVGIVLAALVATGLVVAALAATDTSPFGGEDEAGGSPAPRASVDRFDGEAAFALLRRQVKMGPRPAGSETSRRLARLLRRLLPRGRFEPVPGGLRNVVGTVRGREPGYIVVGAHYDTKEIPGFLGANDGASGTAVVTQLARTLRRPRRTIHFILFDGEEAPGEGNERFFERGLRGSRAAAPRYRRARAMVLLDFVGDERLRIPREQYSSPGLWRRLQRAARQAGVGSVFPPGTQGAIQDDHLPFLELGVPSIDLIDFDFPCWHRTCDDLSVVSQRSVDAVGEAMMVLLASL